MQLSFSCLVSFLFFSPTKGNAQTSITSLSEITETAGNYVITADIDASSFSTSIATFSGTLTAQAKADGTFPVISGLAVPLFTIATDAIISNIMLKSVAISQSGYVGAIACTADGATRIFNCGILPSVADASSNSTIESTNNHCGGLVGYLDGTARVVNCFSYATVSAGTANNISAAGIVGYNNATTTSASINTMVMNCMFYGDITEGKKVSPVYGGTTIDNLQNNNGLNTFNFYAYTKLKTKKVTSNSEYKCAQAVEDKYLNRFEFYRLLLNSNKKLAAIYATGDAANANQMAKWVLDKSIAPYPILKVQGKYTSVINYNTEGLADYDEEHRNQGRKTGTLEVTIRTKSQKTDGGQSWPTATASDVQTTTLTLVRTDKDFANFNYNYDKVQLPYYNDIGTGNATENRIVTGWKITNITAVAEDPYTSANYDYTKTYDSNADYFEYPNYNFADRKSSNKDLYTVSGRVFSQGAYFDVPYGVTAITIEPYWAKCAYISDPNYDVVYTNGYGSKTNVTATGTQVVVGTTFFDGQGFTTNSSDQRIETTVTNALNYIKNNLGGYGSTVYDNAVVLVGNLHLNGVPSGGTDPFTMMSVDTDHDNEPDYSLIYHHSGRTAISPIRFDFLPIVGTAQAQKPNGANNVCNFTIFKTKGWFECTNTAFFYTSQVEYENLDGVSKANAPLILLGGVIDQFVSTQSKPVTGKTIYIHVGGNVWIKEFGMGTHSDGSQSTPHVPVSVTGGDYDGFYLTGTYNQNALVKDDNAECYVSGGRFGEMAGAAQEQIGSTNSASNGNVRWQIYDADITDFYGGGVNEAKPVQGNIRTDIFNSHVTTFCGGPKFGNMATDKTVTTNAEGCTFGKFFGAGYGGNSISRKKYNDNTSYNWITWQGYYTNDKGKYYDGNTTGSSQYSGHDYGKKGPGVATDFDYEFFVWSTGATGARLFVHFVSFSLAQCNDVHSMLKNCIINNDFYGGGSLGKVTGTATSELDGCTVRGNAYGAGFSATLPPIYVRDAGFASDGGSGYLFPNYNKYAGIFEPGTYSDTTEFTWKQVTSYPSEGGAGFDGTQVITTQNLNSDNLGSVGSVSLTLKGNTTVHGSVFGGGDESIVTGNTTVRLQGNASVQNNVYGGGNRGVVGGNSSVFIEDQTP